MPRGVWSAKDERQYGHVLKSCRKGRRSVKTCKRIAAATVNAQRSREGRTLSGLGASFKEQMSSPWMLLTVGIIGYSAGRAIAKGEEAEAFRKLSDSYKRIGDITGTSTLKGLNGCGCEH